MFWPVTVFAAAAAAHPMGMYLDLLHGKRDGIDESQLDSFKFYAEHAAAAYCNYETNEGDAITCGGTCNTLESNGVYSLGSIVGEDTGIGAYISVDDVRGEIVLSVRGSNNIRNFITDVIFDTVSCPFSDGCKVHDGFSASWDELSDWAINTLDYAVSNNPDYTVVTTGHSLGGAVATLAVANLRSSYAMDLYDYGSPRVGNEAFVQFVTDQQGAENRVTHVDDPVPRLPPMFFDYRHTSPEYWLSDGDGDTVSYGLTDILVCDGFASTACNAGTSVGLDIVAHLHYFEDTSACGNPFQWKRDETDDQTAQRLSSWAVKDQTFASGL